MQKIRTIEKLNCYVCGSEGKLLYKNLIDKVFHTIGKWSYYKCENAECNLIWLNPMPVEEDISIAYQSYYTHVDQIEKESGLRRLYSRLQSAFLASAYGYGNSKSIFRFLLYLDPDRLESTKYKVMYLKNIKGRLLDIGCGSGSFIEYMNNYGWETTGIDFDTEAIKTAKQKNLNVKLGSLDEQKFPDNYFDVVTLSHVIEHVYDPLKLLKECFRILKLGGNIVLSTPNNKSLGHKYFKENWRGLEPPRHIHIFSRNSISKILKKSSFGEFSLFTTNRIARYVFFSSLNIKKQRQGKISMYNRIIAKLYSLLEWNLLKFGFDDGEELIVIAGKKFNDQ